MPFRDAMPSSLRSALRPIRSTDRLRRPGQGSALLTLAAVLAGSLGALSGSRALAQATTAPTAAETGSKGAQVYCYMRANGNSHEVSWSAAYALIKRQGSGPFKTSPEHGAVMITEAVVNNPNTFPDCGRFLGDLFSRRRVVYVPTGSMAPTTSGAGTAAPAGQPKW